VKLVGRELECGVLDKLLSGTLAGQSQVIVLRGEPGVGKTALVDYASSRAPEWQVVKTAGVEQEMEIAYAGLHQLLAPMLSSVDRLPEPQSNALTTVFGLSSGSPPDRFLVGLATLTLLADAAERQPVLCVVEDAHWLDQASVQTLGFVSRRLLAERVALIATARTGVGDHAFAGQPELAVDGLRDPDARALLLENVYGPVDPGVCDQILAESRGNPLVLLELSRGMTGPQAGGFGLIAARPRLGSLEMVFSGRLDGLPTDTRLLLVLAAADPVGDPGLLWRSAERLGIDASAAAPALDEGLMTIGPPIRFLHPLVRSAAYRAAEPQERRAVHLALAEATDRQEDPDRRAWHLAAASAGPDEEVALELERSAGRAQARGGLAAAAAFLDRAVAVTADPTRRADRALAAARASFHAGAFEMALQLAATAESGTPLEGFKTAELGLLRAQVAFASGVPGDAAARLFEAARQLEPFDERLARETYMTAWRAALVAGDGGLAVEICQTVVRLKGDAGTPRPIDLLLEGVSLRTVKGLAAAIPVLRRAARALDDAPREDVVRWGWVASIAHAILWDIDGLMNPRHAEILRAMGALAELPIQLTALGATAAWVGDFDRAAALAAEQKAVAVAIGAEFTPWIELRLRAMQGREQQTAALTASIAERAADGSQRAASMHADWATAVLCIGLGRYADAAEAAERATSNLHWWGGVPAWALPELVEAAVRIGDMERARGALGQLLETTRPLGTDYPSGMEARCCALLTDGDNAEALYREAVDRLEQTSMRPELARTHLLYGEWLRRLGRRVDAREHLRTAYQSFIQIGMEAFAERSRKELLATGETVRRRIESTRDQLTPQETQVALLARDGFTNSEIGAQLFLSPRTVEWHLRKVFTKLEIGSRRDLRSALPARATRS
jgi:DNA-binding CsgD family transcriptional regulator